MELVPDPSPKAEDSVYTVVEQNPTFSDGDVGNYVRKNIKFPADELGKGTGGTVYLRFVVDKDGSLKDIKVIKGIKDAPAYELEAIRVVSSMPAWQPGMMNGNPVKVAFVLPIKFSQR